MALAETEPQTHRVDGQRGPPCQEEGDQALGSPTTQDPHLLRDDLASDLENGLRAFQHLHLCESVLQSQEDIRAIFTGLSPASGNALGRDPVSGTVCYKLPSAPSVDCPWKGMRQWSGRDHQGTIAFSRRCGLIHPQAVSSVEESMRTFWAHAPLSQPTPTTFCPRRKLVRREAFVRDQSGRLVKTLLHASTLKTKKNKVSSLWWKPTHLEINYQTLHLVVLWHPQTLVLPTILKSTHLKAAVAR